MYSLMLVVYELLAGRYVFATGRGLSGFPNEKQLVAAHLLRMPTPLHEVAPWIPAYFWPVLEMGLAKEPAARFRHAGAVASALRELRERYLSDVRAGRIAAGQDAGSPGSRREHHGPRSPERLLTAPRPDESRVILHGHSASAELGGSEAREEGAAPAGDPGRPLFATPGPVTARSSPGDRGSSLVGPDLPATDRVADRRWRAQLLRRCVAAAVLAIPLSGAATALYIHARRARPAVAASEGGAALAAPAGGIVASARAEPALSGPRGTGAPPDAPAPVRAAQTGAPAPAVQTDAPAPAAEPPGVEASEVAPSPRTESRGMVAGPSAPAQASAPARPSAPAKASTQAQPSAPATRARPVAGAARAPARRPWDWLGTSNDRDEDEDDIYPMPSPGRAPAPARPAKPLRGRNDEGPVGGPPLF
ncbi:hypothetical protein WME91_29200 [Sorangium sp. So ce269]